MSHKITKENVAAIYPLTPMQEGMLFHIVSHPNSWHYFEQTEIYISGSFDPVCCEQAWNELAKHHEMLRSAFEFQSAAKSLHIILKESPVEFSFEDCTSLQPNLQTERIAAYKTHDRNRGFDLKQDSLLRFKLFQLSENRSCLIWSHPHIILDGWSGSVLQAEFLDVYRSLRNQTPVLLPPAFPLRHYWDWIDRQDHDRAEQYWKNELDGFDAPTSVPCMKKSLASSNYKAAAYRFQLDQTQTSALQQLASSFQTTLNVLLQSVWSMFLRFHNNNDDVLFGCVVSGRPPALQGIERFVGLLINTLPLRITMNGEMSFENLVKLIHDKSMERSEYEFISLPEIQALSPLKNHLFDHIFVFENYPSMTDAKGNDEVFHDGFTIESIETFEQSNYKLGIVIHPGNEIAFQFQYNMHIYSQFEIERITQRLQTVIQSILDHPNFLIHQFNWLNEHDRKFHNSLSQTQVKTVQKSILDLWDEQLINSSESVAVDAQCCLFYKDLDEISNRLASYLLHEINVHTEDRIAVALPRNESVPVALLGVLKAGGCYLPIDGIPEQRIQTVLEDSQAKAVIVNHETKSQFMSINDLPLIEIESCSSYPAGALNIKPKPDELAYMIYTSGSTGKPKGVLIEHGGFAGMIRQQIDIFGVFETDTVLQMATFSFDASLSEIFMALLSGAKLVIAPDEVRKNADAFLDFVKQKQISVVTLSPSFLRTLDQHKNIPIRVLITAGEEAVVEDARFYAKHLHYFNAYGPTESSVCTTIYPVDLLADYPNGIPIGKPLDHLQVFVLNRDLNPVPFGVPGEICICGSGLARGYHQRPQETERSFIHHPSFGRLYRTGDKGVWLDDGNLLFLGRLDNQIKIRGFRVELEEVEHALLQVPEIHQAAVLVNQRKDGTPELTGYYCSKKPIDSHAIRQSLSEQLPSYMIPNRLIPLQTIPINNNGKIDKHAIKQMRLNEDERDIILPQTEHEIALANVIQELLSIDTVCMHVSFQDLGGDSLLAIRVHARLHKQGLELSVGDVMDSVSLQIAAANIKMVVQETPSKIRTTAPCTPVQNWFFHHHQSQLGHFSHCVVLTMNQDADIEILNRAFQFILNSHSALRINIKYQDQRYIQYMRENDQFTVQKEYISQPCQNEKFQEWCDHHASFDIQNDLLFRVFDLHWDDCRFVVMIAHHLVVDAVSWQIILEDLNHVYEKLMHGLTPKLETSVSYLDWSIAVNQMAEQSGIKQKKHYWDSINNKINECVSHNQKKQYRYGDIQYKSLPIPLSELSGFGDPHHQSFIYKLSLTLVCRIIKKISHQNTIGLLLSNHGRYDYVSGMNVAKTVGWFTNYYPVLIPLNTDDIQNQIDAIQTAINELPNHGMDYGLIFYDSDHSEMKEKGCDFLFNFIGEIQSEKNIRNFQIDSNKTRSIVHNNVEFPFRVCFDVLYDDHNLIIEIAYLDIQKLSKVISNLTHKNICNTGL